MNKQDSLAYRQLRSEKARKDRTARHRVRRKNRYGSGEFVILKASDKDARRTSTAENSGE
jgi:hypothetical protein